MIFERQFNAIYKGYYSKVYNMCLGYVKGDSDLAKDLTQEVFIKIFQHYLQFREEANISTWIYRITVNCCLQQLRKKKFLALKIDIASETSEDYNVKESRFKKMFHCIDKLSHENKSIILLELENIPQSEIAEIIGISHSAMRTRIHRIKEQLTKCVKK